MFSERLEHGKFDLQYLQGIAPVADLVGFWGKGWEIFWISSQNHLKKYFLASDHRPPNYFSNNYRKFKLDSSLEQKFNCMNIDNKCLSRDFIRRPNIHLCWDIKTV